jgi:hypothetical protein
VLEGISKLGGSALIENLEQCGELGLLLGVKLLEELLATLLDCLLERLVVVNVELLCQLAEAIPFFGDSGKVLCEWLLLQEYLS